MERQDSKREQLIDLNIKNIFLAKLDNDNNKILNNKYSNKNIRITKPQGGIKLHIALRIKIN